MVNKDNFQEKLMEFQTLQQTMQSLSASIQQLQVEKMEIDNSLAELKPEDKSVFKIYGGLMVEKKTSLIQKELKDRSSEIDLRLKKIEEEEKSARKKIEALQKELMKNLK